MIRCVSIVSDVRNGKLNMRNMEELVYMFGSFLPSQRVLLLEQAKIAPDQFMAALQSFLAKWARADWLEEYNVERVGEWVAKHCPSSVRDKVEAFAKAELAAGVSPSSIQYRTYKAVIDGLARAKAFA